jgi:hypothetical protein
MLEVLLSHAYSMDSGDTMNPEKSRNCCVPFGISMPAQKDHYEPPKTDTENPPYSLVEFLWHVCLLGKDPHHPHKR